MTSSQIFPFSQFPSEPRLLELLPGEVGLGLADDEFKTLLGSCVSVILTDPRRTVGAMCHIVHVSEPGPQDVSNTAYGRVAMGEMYRLLRTVGVTPGLCQAYVYGGGNMFPDLMQHGTVGERNARWVMNFLAAEGIQVLHHSLMGVGHRKLRWTVGPALPQVEQIPLNQE